MCLSRYAVGVPSHQCGIVRTSHGPVFTYSYSRRTLPLYLALDSLLVAAQTEIEEGKAS